MLIEEDMQFECYGIMDCTSQSHRGSGIWRILEELTGLFPSSNAILEKIMNDQSDRTISHLIFSADFAKNFHGIMDHGPNEYIDGANHVDIECCNKIACAELTSTPLMITRIGSERLQCIQKQQSKDIYRYGGRFGPWYQHGTMVPAWFDSEADVGKSIGDDIEDFYNRIKTNEINICMQYSKLDKVTLTDQISSLYPYNNSVSTVRTFHVSMLTDKQENEMSSEFFKDETSLSKDEQNYALSLCARRTFFLAILNRYQELILFDNWESDMARLQRCDTHERHPNPNDTHYLFLNPMPPSDSRVSLKWTLSHQ